MIRVVVAFLFVAVGASAQTLSPSPALTITTVGPGVLLVDDIVYPQATLIRMTDHAAGDTVRVSLVEDLRAWDARRADTTVVMAGAEETIRMQLPVRSRVETLPLGAELTLILADGERRTLGPGPATIDLAPGTAARVMASLDGHLDAAAALPSAVTVTLILPPVGQPDADPVALLPMRGSTRTRTLIDVGIGAAAALAGAVSIHYKFRADDLDDRYRDEASERRGDPALLDEINRNDTYSNVALAGMQVGLGVLAVRFILR